MYFLFQNSNTLNEFVQVFFFFVFTFYNFVFWLFFCFVFFVDAAATPHLIQQDSNLFDMLVVTLIPTAQFSSQCLKRTCSGDLHSIISRPLKPKLILAPMIKATPLIPPCIM